METITREQIQRQALNKFIATPSKRGTICLSTGTGKSKVAIDFIKENTDIRTILITSPRTNLQENWKLELQKWGFVLNAFRSEYRWKIESPDGNHRWMHIVIENIQTAYKWKHVHYDLIIADEIHTMMTPEYSQLFENNRFEYLIGLTATHDITNKNDKSEFYNKYCPIVFEYYDSADDGLINKTRFKLVNHDLSNDHKILVSAKVNGKPAKWQKGELEHYEYLTQRIKAGQQKMLAQGSDNWFADASDWFWKGLGDKEQKFAAMMYLNSIKARKEFLLQLPSTSLIARHIVTGILAASEQSKVLVFSELTAQADTITPHTIHSKNTPKDNQSLMDSFNEGRVRVLGSCQSLTLGLNLKGASHAIMESYIGSATKSNQKKGRLDRLATDDVAEMWIIRVNDTQGNKWFEAMSKSFDLTNAEQINSTKILNNEYDYKNIIT